MKLRATTRIRNDAMIEARQERGWSQKSLAALVGCPMGTICQIEALHYHQTGAARWRDSIADALGLEAEQIAPAELLGENLESIRIVKADVPAQYLIEMATTQARRLELPDPSEPREGEGEGIRKYLPRLTYREREILKLRFGLDEDGMTYTMEETARIFKVTRERVRQVEGKAMRKIYCWISDDRKAALENLGSPPAPPDWQPEGPRKKCRVVREVKR